MEEMKTDDERLRAVWLRRTPSTRTWCPGLFCVPTHFHCDTFSASPVQTRGKARQQLKKTRKVRYWRASQQICHRKYEGRAWRSSRSERSDKETHCETRSFLKLHLHWRSVQGLSRTALNMVAVGYLAGGSLAGGIVAEGIAAAERSSC